MPRTNISVDDAVHERCAALKNDGESWSAFLDRAADALDASDRDRDHTQSTLTTDHIDDIAAVVARRTADEVENRLTRR